MTTNAPLPLRDSLQKPCPTKSGNSAPRVPPFPRASVIVKDWLGRLGLGSHRALPIGLIHEHRAEVAHDVGDAESHTTDALHREERRHARLAGIAAVAIVMLACADVDAVVTLAAVLVTSQIFHGLPSSFRGPSL